MSLRLFTKTYIKDLEWLKLAVTSVDKLCTEPVEWTITIEDLDINELVLWTDIKPKNITFKLIPLSRGWPEWPDIPNGYMRQQWVKMNAHMLMGDDLFWNWDSDVIAIKPFSSQTFLGKSGRPIYWFSQFNSLMGGADQPAHEARREVIKRVIGVNEASFEWMRCMPIPLYGQILRNGSTRQEWAKSLEMIKASNPGFSEFNIIGEFAHQFFPDAYEWKNAEASGPTWSGGYIEGGSGSGCFQEHAIISQCWSWGAIPPEVRNFVNAL